MSENQKGLLQQVAGVYSGPMKSWAYLVTFMGLIFTVGFFYAGWRFWIAETVNDHFHWGVATLLFALFIAMMKIWFWLQMAKNEILENLKK